MPEKVESFVFYRSFGEAIKLLPDANDKILAMEAIVNYALDERLPEFTGTLAAIFALIKPQIDANRKRRENGLKGGRNAKNKPPVLETETTGSKMENQSNSAVQEDETAAFQPRETAKPNVNVNDNDNVNENENANENVNVNDNEENTPMPPTGDNAVDTAVYMELKKRIGTLFNRKENTAWDNREMKLLRAFSRHAGVLDELTEIEKLYRSGYKYCRKDVYAFLNNFSSELDRTRLWQQEQARLEGPQWSVADFNNDFDKLVKR